MLDGWMNERKEEIAKCVEPIPQIFSSLLGRRVLKASSKDRLYISESHQSIMIEAGF